MSDYNYNMLLTLKFKYSMGLKPLFKSNLLIIYDIKSFILLPFKLWQIVLWVHDQSVKVSLHFGSIPFSA